MKTQKFSIFQPLNDHNENFVDTLQIKRDAMQAFLNAFFCFRCFYTFKKMNFSVFARRRLHLKMNFYCMENHKYGNSILDFTLKLLKIHEIALLMHSVTPRLPFCSALPTSKTRRERKKV